MKFKTKKACKNKVDDAFEALQFLRDAYENKQIYEIENISYLFDALDISLDLEDAYKKLREFHIE